MLAVDRPEMDTMKKAWEIENPVALVYRARYGCSKQYVFESADDLETWAARKAYCGEFVTVIAIRDERCLDPKTLPVSDAAKWVREAVSANTRAVQPREPKASEG